MKLTFLFESRGRASASDLVDDTIDRAAHKILELKNKGEQIRDPVSYICRVAQFMLKEDYRTPEKKGTSLDELSPSSLPAKPPDDDSEAREQMHDALERCLERLEPDQRLLIRAFYQGEKRAKKEARVRLAHALGITMNALSLRAFHIRQRLAACLEMRLAAG